MAYPTATYRLQLHSGFNFKDLRKQLTYLHKLGISTIYASPVFQARKGSNHGYDVVDPHRLNEEIGNLSEWRSLKKEMTKLNMTWLQDIVPNHMAFDSSNPWIYNLLELGPNSPYYQYFDIDWDHPDPKLKGKLMAPFLGYEPREAIEKGELKLDFDQGFAFTYYDHRFPLSEASYPGLLSAAIQYLASEPEKEKAYQNMMEIAEEFNTSSNDLDHWNNKKKELIEYFDQDEAAHRSILTIIDMLNSSPQELEDLLEKQHFMLAHWRSTEKQINYRRFFTINDLICLRMEDEEVFRNYHQFVKYLCDEDLIDGIRVDHIDGLFHPREYLQQLRKLVGDDKYIVVEKILEFEEKLPTNWPIQGDSGYSFLGSVNQLFTDSTREESFTDHYQGISEEMHPYDDLIFNNKELIIKQRMGGELENLERLLEHSELLPEDNHSSSYHCKEALAGILAAWPVYRIYPEGFPLSIKDRAVIKTAYDRVLQILPSLKDELDYLLAVFTGKSEGTEADQLKFLLRCQQFTGPLAAKGVEDTTFFSYNRLISHNEVGDSPSQFGIDVSTFHKRMKQRSEQFPRSLNCTATHDTKRGEDARMRINVLSEMEEDWFQLVSKWRGQNKTFKKEKNTPDENEEYFIYQSLVGAWPGSVNEVFIERSKQFLLKALRESKQHSNWSSPEEEYERNTLEFLEAILRKEEFMKAMESLITKIQTCASIYSLSQCLLKITAPGVPDIYQGTELWDLSYVDPDNRRPVDFIKRNEILDHLQKPATELIEEDWIQDYTNPILKLFVMHQALRFRKDHPGFFEESNYLAIETNGTLGHKIIAFARISEAGYFIAVTPHLIFQWCQKNNVPLGEETWADTKLKLPHGFPDRWIDVLSGRGIKAHNATLFVKELFEDLPMVLLKAESNEL